jgi:hypothetical protein
VTSVDSIGVFQSWPERGAEDKTSCMWPTQL